MKNKLEMVGKFVTISDNHGSSCVANFNGILDPIGKQEEFL
jgi:hypothetical protein